MNSSAVFRVSGSERRAKRGLLVKYDKDVNEHCEPDGVHSERSRFVEQRRPTKRKRGAQVHGIPEVSVRPPDHEAPRRVERRRRTPPQRDERGDAPEGQTGADQNSDTSHTLRYPEMVRSLDAGASQDSRWQVDQSHANEQAGVDHGSNQNAQHWLTRSRLCSACNLRVTDGR